MPDIQQSILNRSRVNKFILILDLPKKLKDNKDLFNLNNLQFTIYGTVFPDISVLNEEIRFGGQTLNVPNFTRPPYSPLKVLFKIDNEWKNYLTLYHWINIFNDYKESVFDNKDVLKITPNNVSKSYPEYVKNISIIAINELNEPVIEFTYTDAFPIKMGGYNPDYQRGEEIDCWVEFKYNQFIPKLVAK